MLRSAVGPAQAASAANQASPPLHLLRIRPGDMISAIDGLLHQKSLQHV